MEILVKSSVFYTYITRNNKSYKLIIDKDSCVNIISKSVVEKMALKVNQIYNQR